MNNQLVIELLTTAPQNTWVAIDPSSKSIVARGRTMTEVQDEAQRLGIRRALFMYRRSAPEKRAASAA